MTTIVTDGAAQPGPTGATGATGATGNGAVTQSVDALHASPRSVTDWGPTLNPAIAAGTTHFMFGPFDYPFTTQLTPNTSPGNHGIWLDGDSAMWGDPGTRGNRTRLIWNGTGSGSFIDCSRVTGDYGGGGRLSHLEILWGGNSWTGPLVDLTWTFGFRIYRCYFGAIGTFAGSPTAECAVLAQDVNNLKFDTCEFQDGPAAFATACVLGPTAAQFGTGAVTFRDCTFGAAQSVVNPGSNWIFDGCVFEANTLTSGQKMIDVATTNTGAGRSISLYNCEYWDAIGPGTIVKVASAVACDITAINCADFSAGYGDLEKLYDHQGNGNITILGGYTLNEIDVGSGASANSRKSKIVILGLGTGTGTHTFLANVNTGHTQVVVLGGQLAAGNYDNLQNEGLITLGHERLNYGATPTGAAHSGATNIASVTLHGNDMGGFIVITTSGGGASNTGLIADITFGAATSSYAGGNAQWPGVILGVPATLPSADGGDAAKAWACQPYVSALYNDNTKFSIGVVNAIPATSTIVLPYRIIQL